MVELFKILAELCWRSLVTLLYWEWHLIPRWHLRSILARFPQSSFSKTLVSWGSLGEYSMVDNLFGDAFGVLSFLFWSTGLQRGVLLQIQTLNYWTVQSVYHFFSCGCKKCDIAHLSVTLHIVNLWKYFVCCTRSGVIRCTLFMVLYLCRMCQCGLHPVLWSIIGVLMPLLAVGPRSPACLLFPFHDHCGTIKVTVFDRVGLMGFRALVMLSYWLRLLAPLLFYIIFSISSFFA